MNVTVLDYSVGNLHSIRKALRKGGAEVTITEGSPEAVAGADALVLPGVGAFGAAADAIAPLRDALRDFVEAGRPMLGVCLGMQLLFDESEESPGEGLGVIPGKVARLRHPKLPQIGWNAIAPREDPLVTGLPPDPHVYYVNSFAPVPRDDDAIVATTTYGEPFAAIVRTGNTYGTQFHPEKSGRVGLHLLDRFLELAEAAR